MNYLDLIADLGKVQMQERYSCRKYNNQVLEAEALQKISMLCQNFRPYPTVKAFIVEQDAQEMFKFIMGYGLLTGIKTALVLVNKKDCEFELGFTGEAFLLAATKLGINTCWVAGTLDKAKVLEIVNYELAGDEEVLAISPLGYSENKTQTKRKRLDILQIAPDYESFPAWAKAAAEAVRIAPSGINAQAWRLSMQANRLVVKMQKYDKITLFWGEKKRSLDMGIAFCHIELAAKELGVFGRIEKISKLEAHFVPNS